MVGVRWFEGIKVDQQVMSCFSKGDWLEQGEAAARWEQQQQQMQKLLKLQKLRAVMRLQQKQGQKKKKKTQ